MADPRLITYIGNEGSPTMTDTEKSLWEKTKELAEDAAGKAKKAAKEVLDDAKETGE